MTAVLDGPLAINLVASKYLHLNPKFIGSGSLTFSFIPSNEAPPATVKLGQFLGQSFTSLPSTYTGGTTVNADVTLLAGTSSQQSPSGEVQSGPLGTGTLTLAGVTLELFGSGSTTLGNSIRLTASSAITANAEAPRYLVGAITFTHRLNVFPTELLVLKDAQFAATDSGTLTIAGGSNGLEIHVSSGTSTLDAGLQINSHPAVKSGAGKLVLNGTKMYADDTGTLSVSAGTLGFSVGTSSTGTFGGLLRVAGNHAEKLGSGTMVLNGQNLASSDTGTFVTSAGTLQLDVGSGNTGTWGGYIGVLTSGTVSGALAKTGAGTFSGKRVRVADLNVGSGMLQVGTTTGSGTVQGVGDNTGAATSFVNALTIGSGAKLDLSNNELIVDYSSSSPIATVNGYLASGFASGSWNGSGINSSAASGSGSFTIGIGDTSHANVGSMTFSGIQTDSTALLIGFTYYGDANMDGSTTITDFSIVGSNFNLAGYWYQGDFNYDGTVGIGDFGLLASNYNASGAFSRGLPPLAELYIAILDHPAIYWEPS